VPSPFLSRLSKPSFSDSMTCYPYRMLCFCPAGQQARGPLCVNHSAQNSSLSTSPVILAPEKCMPSQALPWKIALCSRHFSKRLHCVGTPLYLSAQLLQNVGDLPYNFSRRSGATSTTHSPPHRVSCPICRISIITNIDLDHINTKLGAKIHALACHSAAVIAQSGYERHVSSKLHFSQTITLLASELSTIQHV
jgi:hypothetical protein